MYTRTIYVSVDILQHIIIIYDQRGIDSNSSDKFIYGFTTIVRRPRILNFVFRFP